METTTQLDPSSLQNLLGGGQTSLIPESLVTTLTVGFIVLNVLGILFFVFYVVSLVRKWKVESAVLHMQKDVAELKDVVSRMNQPSVVAEPAQVEPTEVPQPGQSSREIATAGDSSNPPTVS